MHADRLKRQGLRIGFAVAGGMTAAVASGSVMPFLGPLFAAQFLVSSPKPLALRQAIGLVIIIFLVGQAMVLLTGLTGDRPVVLLALLGLIYFGCFLLLARGKGGPVGFLIIVIAIMVPMLGLLHKDLGESIVGLLLKGVLSGVALTWLTHLVFPDSRPDTLEPPVVPLLEGAEWRALANAAILVMMVAVCLVSDLFSSAIVVPITVASVLNQIDLANSRRAAFGLMIVNLLGGIAASTAFLFLEIRPTLIFLFLIVLIVGLLFGGRAADRQSGKIYAGALTIFIILFGLGVSPLPTSAGDSFATRIGQVLFAIACTACLTALLWPAARARRKDSPLDIDAAGDIVSFD
ncbi:DUF2955 domain-containing protein [Mesorhizobium sp. B1-1-8]|uniref:DUF2955 domain-containing protein n=1 Tax=Mesorhizobium sp. B1-1-8 TaxID=2589976 RepID=UPI0011297DC4|nr:DUF2955 domain-containing protein [Mesorhizobium sp. B1-1-8]UCI05653.1 DUF2955 domain-containing protein [Mesorhizobium sp. B1-1-8]